MTGPDTSVTRWLLLCALAFCVVGTHHLGLSGPHEHGGPAPVAVVHTVAAAVDDPIPEGDGADALLHLCIAMLASVAVLLVRGRKARRGPASAPRHFHVRRAPPGSLPLPSPVVLRL